MAWESSNRRSRLPADWSTRIVPTVLRVHRGRCHLCGHTGATEVDHVIPGDDHRFSNLRPAHTECHRAKTTTEAIAARARLRALRHRPPEAHPLDRLSSPLTRSPATRGSTHQAATPGPAEDTAESTRDNHPGQ
ncbi:HNH endonuclease signature motif containing protein [Amycolatopsis sp. NPDC021455]|uniref:HNH endonuclease n=1 Tax=Amycolatopsis sp. NPDC021455 TaxID=3154901 RepID=UPI0033D9E1C7